MSAADGTEVPLFRGADWVTASPVFAAAFDVLDDLGQQLEAARPGQLRLALEAGAVLVPDLVDKVTDAVDEVLVALMAVAGADEALQEIDRALKDLPLAVVPPLDLGEEALAPRRAKVQELLAIVKRRLRDIDQ